MTKNLVGLSQNEVEKSREKHGSNSLDKEKSKGFFRKFFENLNDPIIKVLIFAVIIEIAVSFGNCNYLELFGIISAIIMGMGMSLVMTDIGATLGIENAILPGIIIGAAGLGLTLLTYPIYKKILNNRRTKYSSEILNLSEKLINK